MHNFEFVYTWITVTLLCSVRPIIGLKQSDKIMAQSTLADEPNPDPLERVEDIAHLGSNHGELLTSVAQFEEEEYNERSRHRREPLSIDAHAQVERNDNELSTLVAVAHFEEEEYNERSRHRRDSELFSTNDWSSLECGYMSTKCDDDVGCVHLVQRCNNISDCLDSSDEMGCDNSTCPDDYFRCSSGRCIHIMWMCDNITSCPDGEDEKLCGNASIKIEGTMYFRCNSGQYVFPLTRCDPTWLSSYCLDGSDDENCENDTCPEDMYRCSNGFCIDIENICNTVTDCPDNEDETDCESEDSCGPAGFRCANGRCISVERRCDMRVHCLDGSDEQACETVACGDDHIRCRSGGCYRNHRRCDGTRDCNDGSDEENCQLDKCPGMYRCRYGECAADICRPSYRSCNKGTDPTDHCGKTACSIEYFDCGGGDVRCLHHVSRCDNITDCSDGRDEMHCGLTTCRSDQIECGDGNCIPRALLCDGYKHCANGADESNCMEDSDCSSEDQACTSIHGANICIESQNLCDKSSQCLLHKDERRCYTSCPDGCVCVLGLIDCGTGQTVVSSNSTQEVWPFDNIFSAKANEEFNLSLADTFSLVLSHSELTYIPTKIFVYVPNLHVLDLSYNSIKKISAGDFDGLYRLSVLNLSYNKLESVEGHSFEGLRIFQLNIRNNHIKVFDTRMFHGMAADGNIVTDSYKFCCIRPDHLPEGQCFPHADQFSNCDDLIKDFVLRVLMWILGTFALIGNVVSLCIRVKATRTVNKLSYHIFVMNLCVSDFLMGVYMIIIASVDELYRGEYIAKDEAWRGSVWCSLAGVLAIVSSETSVFFIALITIDRCLIANFPFGQFSISTRLAMALSFFVWILSVLLATIPLILTDYFDSNYYGISGVCLSLPLTTTHQIGWEYSIFIYVFLNFVIFIMIAAGQIFIYYRFSSTRKQSQIAVKRNDGFKVAKRLMVVALSDFLCWVPIGCMCSLAMADIVISPRAYAFVVIFVLPINSVLNPFLYTLISALC